MAARRPSRGRGTDRGSILAALMVTIAVMSIMLTVATQQWSFILKREREQELIFRGERLHHAINDARSAGRQITKLEDLTKRPKPLLRMIPPDPMTARYDRDGKLIEGTGRWVLVRPRPPVQAGQARQPPSDDEATTPPKDADEALGPDGEPLPDGRPVLGVRSRSHEKSIAAWGDVPPESPYSQWRFAENDIGAGIPRPTAAALRTTIKTPPGFGGLRIPGGPPFRPGVPQLPGGR